MMLVRVIFSLMVTLGLLAGAVLWHADAPEVERASEALEPVAERALELADETAERLEEQVREAAPALAQAVRAAAAAVDPPAPEAAVSPVTMPIKTTLASDARQVAPEPVEEESLDPTRQQPFVEGPTDDDDTGSGEGILVAEAPGPARAFFDGPAPDQQEWAVLIRRMLALRIRVEGGR